MPDTTILRTPDGWIDKDAPTAHYAVRRFARAARKARLTGVTPTISSGVAQFVHRPDSLTSLQTRLFERFKGYGIPADEAYDAIRKYGYNQAASYGYIRNIGATVYEAEKVVEVGIPEFSIAYFEGRSIGLNHDEAWDDADLAL